MPAHSPATLIVLATYNERQNLPRLVDEILAVAPQADLLVIDDNSPDGTGRWCDERAVEEPRLHCLHRAGKLGLGSATLEGFGYALERAYELVVTMDADHSHPPREIPALLAATDLADVAIGSRYCPGGAIEGWPLRRRLMSRWMNAASRLLLRLPVRDCTGAYRCYRAVALRELELEEVRATGYAYLEEILWHLRRQEATFREVPITFVDRVAGQSKINLREAASAVGTLLRLGARNLTGR